MYAQEGSHRLVDNRGAELKPLICLPQSGNSLVMHRYSLRIMVYQETGDVPFPKGTASHTYPNGVTVTETPSISTTLTVTVVGAEATSVLKHYYRLLEEYGGTVTVHSTFPEKVKALFEDTSGMWERIQILWRWIRHGE